MKTVRNILIVEDEEIIRIALREFLQSEGYEVRDVGTVAAALHWAQQQPFQVAICDVQLPDGDGVALLQQLLQIQPQLNGLIITAYATVENAVQAFKAGAFDYLVKPVIFDDLANKLQRLFQYRELYQENLALRRELARRDDQEQLIGSSKAMQELREAMRRAAVTRTDVLLVGESGSGKELIARLIHRWGPKHYERFLTACTTTGSEEQIERLLFGVDCKSASDESAEELGLLRYAGDGTVFLDEITSLPMGTQAKLLRALEYREVLPWGAAEPKHHRARIIMATTRDLSAEVAAGRFDENLFYRLDGMKIRIPPLRERLDDIPELVEYFITRHNRAMGQRVTGATSETIRLLLSANWVGNVRQLDNAIQRAVMMCQGSQLRPQDLPPDIVGSHQPLPDTDDLRSALRHYEKLHIMRVLRQWPDKREAARRLRLGLSSLYRKIEELGIDA
ncbi:MAG: sigma-54-dependent Fis family transcriptional regulator [Planctomycetaceae bacterium]|nr:MAG: sigma-54-dependent Fis family transcriptional regulator [Planctomycetaceae bacterium]